VTTILESLEAIWNGLSEFARNLLVNPVFWIVILIFCIALFANSIGESKSTVSQRSFAQGLKGLWTAVTNMFLDLFNSVLDAVNVALNFLKEISNLLFGNLHEERVYKLAGFGVVFLSTVSFWTTSNGLMDFVGFGWNWLASFAIQSAILIVDFTIVKHYCQDREMRDQIKKLRLDQEAAGEDLVFQWKTRLEISSKRAERKSRQLLKKVTNWVEDPNHSELVDALEELKKFLQDLTADRLVSLLKDAGLVETSDDKDFRPALQETITIFECKDAGALKKERESRIREVDNKIKRDFSNCISRVEKVLSQSPKTASASGENPKAGIEEAASRKEKEWERRLRADLLKIDNAFNNTSLQNTIFQPYAMEKEKIKPSRTKSVAFRYASGAVRTMYGFKNYALLSLALMVFIGLSSSFSYTYIYDVMFNKKQDIEHYHMTVQLCNDVEAVYQESASQVAEKARKNLEEFGTKVQESDYYKVASANYDSYYEAASKKAQIEERWNNRNDDEVDNGMTQLQIIADDRNRLNDFNDNMSQDSEGKDFYEAYLAFHELCNNTTKAQNLLKDNNDDSNSRTGEVSETETADGANTDPNVLKSTALSSRIRNADGTEALVETLSAQMIRQGGVTVESLNQYNEWARIYDRLLESNLELAEYQDNKGTEMNDGVEGIEAVARKSGEIIQTSREFCNDVINAFADIPVEPIPDFCKTMRRLQTKLNDQERLINPSTGKVEKAMAVLFSPYVPQTNLMFCLLIAFLFDFSVFVILFVRGIKNQAHMLEKMSVLIEKIFLRDTSDRKNSIRPEIRSSVIVVSMLIALLIIFILVSIPVEVFRIGKEFWFFIIWLGLYLVGMLLAKWVAVRKYPKDSQLTYQQQEDFLESNLFNMMSRISSDWEKRTAIADEYENLLIQQFKNCSLYISDSFRRFKEGMLTDPQKSMDDFKQYIPQMKTGLWRKIRVKVMEDYLSDQGMDFLSSLVPDDSTTYDGYDYMFQRALDTCLEKPSLLAMYSLSLYPTLLYIENKTVDEKDFRALVNLLIGDELAHIEEDKVYMSPLFSRILNELLYEKLSDDGYGRLEVSDVQSDFGMDEIVESYIKDKYSSEL